MDLRSIEERKAALLDQLENPVLTGQEIEKIERKLAILDDQE